jgi:Transposase, Mutator family
VPRARNLYAKLPERERVRAAYWRALDEAINEQDAKQRLQAPVDQLDKAGFTAAARCLADDLDALVVHLRYPPRHRRKWRSTNLVERSLGEVKRRTKVMGRLPGQESCLSLVWAVLDLLIIHETNGIRFNPLDRQRLKRIRWQGHEQPTDRRRTGPSGACAGRAAGGPGGVRPGGAVLFAGQGADPNRQPGHRGRPGDDRPPRQGLRLAARSAGA